MSSLIAFVDARLSRKLFLLVVVSALILGTATIASLWRVHALGNRADKMYAEMTAPLHLLGDLEAQFVQVRVSVRDALLSRTPEESETHVKTVQTLIEDVKAKSDAFDAFADRDPELEALHNEYLVRLAAFLDVGGRVLAAHAAGDRETALETMFSECIPDAAALREHLVKVRGVVLRKAELLEQQMSADVDEAERVAAVIFTVALLISLALAHRLATRTTRRVVALHQCLDAVAEGHLDVQLSSTSKDEVGQMTRALQRVVAQQDAMARAVETLSNGDLTASMPVRGTSDTLGLALQRLQQRLQAVITVIERQVDAARQGQLDARADSAEFSGAFAVLVTQTNDMMAAISAPSQAVQHALQQMASRDLETRLPTTFPGDFGTTSTAFNAAVAHLASAVGSVRKVAFAVDDASGSISEAAEGLSTRAQAQAMAIRELEQSLEELRQLATTATARSEQATQSTATAQSRAARAGALATELDQAMQRIKESSDDTARIISSIDQIAFQTNLLALNAAVEAARAGDAGRGFAVVADEVRALALRSAEAARSTSTLIEAQQQSADDGVRLNASVQSALREISHSMDDVQTSMHSLRSTTAEEHRRIDTITDRVAAISRATQEAAESAQQTASGSVLLRQQAADLTAAVRGFKTRDLESRPGVPPRSARARREGPATRSTNGSVSPRRPTAALAT